MCGNSGCKDVSKKRFLGVLLTCRTSDIILSNSFQNVTAEAPVKHPAAISHKVFSQSVTLLKKGKSNFY